MLFCKIIHTFFGKMKEKIKGKKKNTHVESAVCVSIKRRRQSQDVSHKEQEKKNSSGLEFLDKSSDFDICKTEQGETGHCGCEFR